MHSTSRSRQEPALSFKMPPSYSAPALRARVFATSSLDVRKVLDSPVRVFFLAKSKRRKKNYVRFNFLMMVDGHAWTRPQPKSLDFGHLPVANSKGEPDFANFPSRHGPILTRIGAYENQDLKLFVLVVLFFVGLVSGFLFSVQKTENRFGTFQIGGGKNHQHKKEHKKITRSRT